MKIALINDTHFGARGDHPLVNDYFFRFWEGQFFPYLAEHNIKTVVHLGDVVDRRKFINFKIAKDFKERFMNRFWREGIDTHILIGNHDIYFKDTNEVNAIDNLCTSFDGVHEPFIYTGPKTVYFDGIPIALVPWVNQTNFDEVQALLNTTPAQIIFGHLEIAGFQMDRGNYCMEGLKRSMFDRFDKVITGHFHHKSDDGTVFYLGAQYEMTWADHGDPRGFHVFDTTTRQLEYIENPIKLFQKIEYDDTKQDFEYWKSFDMTPYANAYVKVIVQRKNNPYLFDTMIDNLYKVNPIDINIVEDFTDTAITNDAEIVNQAEDTFTILTKTVNALETPLNKARLIDTLRDVYNEAHTIEKN
jgi:hypothetical protein